MKIGMTTNMTEKFWIYDVYGTPGIIRIWTHVKLFRHHKMIRTQKVRKLKNRSPPAKQRKQPIEPLTIENIRKCQQEDDEISGILRLNENSDSVKPPISFISHNSFEYKFWYSRWELLTIDRGYCVTVGLKGL